VALGHPANEVAARGSLTTARRTKMKRLILGKIRDTRKMERIAGRSGNPNDCYSTYDYLLYDKRDGKYFRHQGYYWDGLGPDTLYLIEDPAALIESEKYQLSDTEVLRLRELGLAQD
jgi:hypothetical protein